MLGWLLTTLGATEGMRLDDLLGEIETASPIERDGLSVYCVVLAGGK